MAGALPEAELAAAVANAGFLDFMVVARHDLYEEGRRGSGAERYRSYGVTFRAKKR